MSPVTVADSRIRPHDGRGRVLNTEGKPVPGARVVVLAVLFRRLTVQL